MWSTLRRKPLAWAAAGAAVLVIAGLFWFEPWRLWTDTTVDDEIPAAIAEPGTGRESGPSSGPDGSATPSVPVLVAEGAFVSHEHETEGTARLFRRPDGSYALALTGLDTSDGPDLRVWLTDQEVAPDAWDVFDDGYHVELGELKGNKGDQLYEIPAGADLERVTSVTIWCARFAVSFGAAALE